MAPALVKKGEMPPFKPKLFGFGLLEIFWAYYGKLELFCKFVWNATFSNKKWRTARQSLANDAHDNISASLH